jgi:hypothetical protein
MIEIEKYQQVSDSNQQLLFKFELITPIQVYTRGNIQKFKQTSKKN